MIKSKAFNYKVSKLQEQFSDHFVPISYDDLKLVTLEDGDLIEFTDSKENTFKVVYINNQWYAIVSKPTLSKPMLVPIKEDVMKPYDIFIIETLDGNPYQFFIKTEGKEKFDSLSEEDKCYVYSNEYYEIHAEEVFSGLKTALQDVVNILKEIKEDENNA